jgi:hypothetical protein
MVHLMKEMFSGMGTRQSLEAMTENKLWCGRATNDTMRQNRSWEQTPETNASTCLLRNQVLRT